MEENLEFESLLQTGCNSEFTGYIHPEYNSAFGYNSVFTNLCFLYIYIC